VSTASDAYQYRAGSPGQCISEQVVIGTHGKLKNWVMKKMLVLDAIAILVFDEADEMLKEDGFADDSVRRRRRPVLCCCCAGRDAALLGPAARAGCWDAGFWLCRQAG
jgi:hypothetical protein